MQSFLEISSQNLSDLFIRYKQDLINKFSSKYAFVFV